MGTRFGARTPLHAYVARVHWILGGMSALLILLCVSLLYVGFNHEAANSAEVVSEEALPESGTRGSFIDVVVARRRIEAGQRLEPDHFSLQPFPAASIPLAALQAEHLSEIIGKYSTALLRAGYPLSRDDVSASRPISQLNIPNGYRAVSITADDRELVAGHVTPMSRVDVLWRYKDKRGLTKVKPLVKFAKVLSVNGDSRQSERSQVSKRGTTATLLVTAKEAQLVELARGLGTLSMVLIGMGDNGSRMEVSSSVDERELYGENTVAEEEQPLYSGQAYVPDPATGRVRRYVLTDKWALDTRF